jgi:hypothetical protein
LLTRFASFLCDLSHGIICVRYRGLWWRYAGMPSGFSAQAHEQENQGRAASRGTSKRGAPFCMGSGFSALQVAGTYCHLLPLFTKLITKAKKRENPVNSYIKLKKITYYHITTLPPLPCFSLPHTERENPGYSPFPLPPTTLIFGNKYPKSLFEP